MGRVEVDRSVPWAVSWTVMDEPMERSSHALAHEGRVWLIDPVEDEEALAAVAQLGEVAAVVQLLDRHPRAGEGLAARYGVDLLRLPEVVLDSPFQVYRTRWLPGWRELRLWWPEHEALVVPEAVGTASYFRAGRRAGVHPFLRALPPGGLRAHTPRHLLCGHGPPLHEGAASALDEALRCSRRDIPRALVEGARAFIRP